MSEWQPIETAPKDGSRVMLFLGEPWSRIEICHWFDAWGNWQPGENPDETDEYSGVGAKVPTHWMPLPKPPLTPRTHL